MDVKVEFLLHFLVGSLASLRGLGIYFIEYFLVLLLLLRTPLLETRLLVQFLVKWGLLILLHGHRLCFNFHFNSPRKTTAHKQLVQLGMHYSTR